MSKIWNEDEALCTAFQCSCTERKDGGKSNQIYEGKKQVLNLIKRILKSFLKIIYLKIFVLYHMIFFLIY